MYPRIRTAVTIYARRPSPSNIHTSSTARHPTSQKHSTDAYMKDVDPTPPEDTSMYQIDPAADVQKSTEPPAGEYSRAGAETNAYEHVDNSSHPYAAPGQTQRYGNRGVWAKDKGPETSGRDEGPEGKASGGRKPEGR
ncbi:hypothetical protein AX17_003770 [Amanita inopinata Kibby_2008]|nr:hypothetical protein AX17_003770 [Amanita inopinata Kibby_2008]